MKPLAFEVTSWLNLDDGPAINHHVGTWTAFPGATDMSTREALLTYGTEQGRKMPNYTFFNFLDLFIFYFMSIFFPLWE